MTVPSEDRGPDPASNPPSPARAGNGGDDSAETVRSLPLGPIASAVGSDLEAPGFGCVGSPARPLPGPPGAGSPLLPASRGKAAPAARRRAATAALKAAGGSFIYRMICWMCCPPAQGAPLSRGVAWSGTPSGVGSWSGQQRRNVLDVSFGAGQQFTRRGFPRPRLVRVGPALAGRWVVATVASARDASASRRLRYPGADERTAVLLWVEKPKGASSGGWSETIGRRNGLSGGARP